MVSSDMKKTTFHSLLPGKITGFVCFARWAPMSHMDLLSCASSNFSTCNSSSAACFTRHDGSLIVSFMLHPGICVWQCECLRSLKCREGSPPLETQYLPKASLTLTFNTILASRTRTLVLRNSQRRRYSSAAGGGLACFEWDNGSGLWRWIDWHCGPRLARARGDTIKHWPGRIKAFGVSSGVIAAPLVGHYLESASLLFYSTTQQPLKCIVNLRSLGVLRLEEAGCDRVTTVWTYTAVVADMHWIRKGSAVSEFSGWRWCAARWVGVVVNCAWTGPC